MIAVRKKEGRRKRSKEGGEWRNFSDIIIRWVGVERREGGRAENEQADKNEEQTWQSIGRTDEGGKEGAWQSQSKKGRIHGGRFHLFQVAELS